MNDANVVSSTASVLPARIASISPPRVIRRPVNYSPSIPSVEPLREYRKLLVYIGDMVQVIDPKSHLVGKFGLVEDICPKDPNRQVTVKIGKMSNPLKFHQLKFCTRIDSVARHTKSVPEESVSESRVSDYIDEVEDDENAGNREGMNERHGVKL